MNKSYSLGLYEKAFPSCFDFPMMLKMARLTDFDRLELSIDETEDRIVRLYWKEREVLSLLRQCEYVGISIKTICLSALRKYPLGSHDPQTREKSVEIVKRTLDFASLLNVRIIMLAGYDVYYEKGDEITRKYFIENLKNVVRLAAEYGIILAFETMETPFMDTVEKAMVYVNLINSPWLCIYPDIGNLQNAAVLYGKNVLTDLASGIGHICAIHLKETVPNVYRDMKINGEGHTKYDDCINFAAKNNIRIFTGEFWYQGTEDYLAELKRTSEFLREKLDSAFVSKK